MSKGWHSYAPRNNKLGNKLVKLVCRENAMGPQWSQKLSLILFRGKTKNWAQSTVSIWPTEEPYKFAAHRLPQLWTAFPSRSSVVRRFAVSKAAMANSYPLFPSLPPALSSAWYQTQRKKISNLSTCTNMLTPLKGSKETPKNLNLYLLQVCQSTWDLNMWLLVIQVTGMTGYATCICKYFEISKGAASSSPVLRYTWITEQFIDNRSPTYLL